MGCGPAEDGAGQDHLTPAAGPMPPLPCRYRRALPAATAPPGIARSRSVGAAGAARRRRPPDPRRSGLWSDRASRQNPVAGPAPMVPGPARMWLPAAIVRRCRGAFRARSPLLPISPMVRLLLAWLLLVWLLPACGLRRVGAHGTGSEPCVSHAAPSVPPSVAVWYSMRKVSRSSHTGRSTIPIGSGRLAAWLRSRSRLLSWDHGRRTPDRGRPGTAIPASARQLPVVDPQCRIGRRAD